jgi:YbgC/YbaW family acyl-CoA thioester hydrolase
VTQTSEDAAAQVAIETEFAEIRIPLRWTDFDPAGHVTDTAYPSFLSEARGAYIARRLGPYTEWPCVVRKVAVDYASEIPYPSPYVVVRTRVASIGRTSVTFEQEVRKQDGSLAATSTATLVAFDPRARTSREIPPEDRVRLLTT